MARRILVLASNSFAGSNFVDFCLSRNCEVLGVSRSPEYIPALLGYAQNTVAQEKFHFHQIDLNSDLRKLLSLIHEFEPEDIVDFAGQGMVAQSWTAPEQWMQTNVISKIKLHEELRKMSSIRTYIRFSTPEVYGNTEGAVDEAAPLNPSTPYAVSHAAIDMSLKSYFNHYRFPVILTRASNIYGPHQQLYRIIPRAIINHRIGKKLFLDGGGHSIRNFVFMSDVCDAIWRILENPAHGEVYHIASDDYLSIRSLVEKIYDLIGADFATATESGPDRPSKDKAYYLKTEKIYKQYGWRATTPLNVGLQATIDWIGKDFDALIKTPLEYLHKV